MWQTSEDIDEEFGREIHDGARYRLVRCVYIDNGSLLRLRHDQNYPVHGRLDEL